MKLDKEYPSEKPIKVIITFLEEVETSSQRGLALTDFSFARSRQALASYQGSFGDTLADERRSEV